MTPTLGYLLALLATTSVTDFTLHTLSLKILEPLRDSYSVFDMAMRMPPDIMLILALSTLTQGTQGVNDRWWAALVVAGVMVAVRLLGGRRLPWDIGIGTACYVALLSCYLLYTSPSPRDQTMNYC